MSELFTDALVDSYDEGLKKVKEGNYALIYDEAVNLYTTQNECDLMVAQETFNSREYGIGIRKGVGKLRSEIATMFLQLDEESFTEKMYTK